jgi:general stress protein YciG
LRSPTALAAFRDEQERQSNMQYENPNDRIDETTAQGPSPDPQPEPLEAPAAPRKRRGFAAMDKAKVSELARRGGKAAHAAGTAHEFTTEEAREAGRKGGRASHAKRAKPTETSVS